MADYRDDLAAAHRRIAQLEERLGVRAGPSPRRSRLPRHSYVIACVGLSLFACSFTMLSKIAGPKSTERGPIVEGIFTDRMPELVGRELADAGLHGSWYTQPAVLPAMVDVDHDGTKDIVGLFWRSGQDALPLYASAIDGATFALKWSAGPFKSQWSSTRTHLVVAGDKVLVSDSQEQLHILELRTGHELSVVKLEGGVVEMCATADGTPRAVLRSANANESYVFDGATTLLAKTPKAVCPVRYDSCYASKDGAPCFQHGSDPKAPSEAKTSSSFYVARTLEEAGLAIALGTATAAGAENREPPQAVAFVPGAAAPLWKGALLPEAEAIHFGGAQTELRNGRLVALYQTKRGPFRLASRDGRTGKPTWHVEIPGSHEGSYAAAFGVEDDRVLVVMNQTLHVFDAKRGAHLAALGARNP